MFLVVLASDQESNRENSFGRQILYRNVALKRFVEKQCFITKVKHKITVKEANRLNKIHSFGWKAFLLSFFIFTPISRIFFISV